jgi:hypothetical protein
MEMNEMMNWWKNWKNNVIGNGNCIELDNSRCPVSRVIRGAQPPIYESKQFTNQVSLQLDSWALYTHSP